MKKLRIAERYSPICGTWFVIQRKFLLWWITYPHCFETFEYARDIIAYGDASELDKDICETIKKKIYDEKENQKNG